MQGAGAFIELAGFGRSDQRSIDLRHLLHAAQGALESVAAGAGFARPATFKLVGNRIEPRGNPRGSFGCARSIAGNGGVSAPAIAVCSITVRS